MIKKPLKRQKPPIDRGQNSAYNLVWKTFLSTTGVRNDELTAWVAEAELPYSKSLVAGWRCSADHPKRYRLMRLEELQLMTELVWLKRRNEPVVGLAERVTIKGYALLAEKPSES